MKNNLFSLEGKNAVVIGGYRGIGSIFSEIYADAGANVIICARSVEKCKNFATKLNKYKTLAQFHFFLKFHIFLIFCHNFSIMSLNPVVLSI